MRTSKLLGLLLIAGTIASGCADAAPTLAEVATASAHDHPGMNAVASGDPSVAGGVAVDRLARGNFPDNIDATFKIKLNRATQVVHVRDPSDAMVAKLTFQAGGSVGWHTHHGPVIVTVASGTLSIINTSDCVRRDYAAGKAFVDPGQGNVHVGFNGTAGETVVYATFLGVPAGQPATIPAVPGCGL
jgi:hypothetical protein